MEEHERVFGKVFRYAGTMTGRLRTAPRYHHETPCDGPMVPRYAPGVPHAN